MYPFPQPPHYCALVVLLKFSLIQHWIRAEMGEWQVWLVHSEEDGVKEEGTGKSGRSNLELLRTY